MIYYRNIPNTRHDQTNLCRHNCGFYGKFAQNPSFSGSNRCMIHFFQALPLVRRADASLVAHSRLGLLSSQCHHWYSPCVCCLSLARPATAVTYSLSPCLLTASFNPLCHVMHFSLALLGIILPCY